MEEKRKLIEQKYEFRILKSCDYREVWPFMAKYFVTREPMSHTLQLNEEEGFKFIGEYVQVCCQHEVSLAAYDRETNELVAVRLSNLGKLLDNCCLEVPDDFPVKSKQTRESMRSVLGSDLSETLGTKDYMEFVLLCCRPDHSNTGIASELYIRSFEIAKQNGAKKVFTMATSYYTQCIAKKFGFRREYEIPYAEYVDPFTGTKIFENMEPPHVSMSREVKDME